MDLFGRRVIYNDNEFITDDNVVEALEKALEIHSLNSNEIEYLYNYYKGEQPILRRIKSVRGDINNKIVINRANEIVSFKVGYLMGQPVQYVSRSGNDNENTSKAINLLNDYAFSESKASKDKQLADWFHICGTAFRMILADKNAEETESPFKIYTLNPLNTFVVYWSGLGNKPLMGVTYVKQEDNSTIYSVYTDRAFYTIRSDDDGFKITNRQNHILRAVPIIEYPANQARLGAFEIVIELLDAINTVTSNRIDGIEQFVQSILVLLGTSLGEGKDKITIKDILEQGGIALPDGTDAKYLTQELNQTQTQTLEDAMYDAVLTICGMPNRNGGSSTSDTGAAVILRDGWSSAETGAQATEQIFDVSEKQFLKIAIDIMNTFRHTDLSISSVDIRFTRRNYENIQAKAQVLTTMLANSKIHPRLAFEYCGMFADPENAYSVSEKYTQEQEKADKQKLKEITEAEDNQQKKTINENPIEGEE